MQEHPAKQRTRSTRDKVDNVIIDPRQPTYQCVSATLGLRHIRYLVSSWIPKQSLSTGAYNAIEKAAKQPGPCHRYNFCVRHTPKFVSAEWNEESARGGGGGAYNAYSAGCTWRHSAPRGELTGRTAPPT